MQVYRPRITQRSEIEWTDGSAADGPTGANRSDSPPPPQCSLHPSVGFGGDISFFFVEKASNDFVVNLHRPLPVSIFPLFVILPRLPMTTGHGSGPAGGGGAERKSISGALQ